MESKEIAIAISTHNRRSTFNKCYEKHLEFKPNNADIFIVDDGSDIPLIIANARHEKPKGIAYTKNKCLSLTKGYKHVFLFDDDIHPIVKDWHLSYINSEHVHLCYSMDWDIHTRCIKKNPTEWIYSNPNGCMLYFRDGVANEVGGYDENFGFWGMEHKDLSLRIHKAGFTKYPYMDVPSSSLLLKSLDYHKEVESSVSESVRRQEIKRNLIYYESLHNNT